MAEHPFLILVGTKAQFIKTAPILKEMDRVGMPYRLVYTGQHSETFDSLEQAFDTPPADDVLVPGVEAATHGSFLGWAAKYWVAVIRRLPGWRACRAGIVHGDTASTLFGAMALKLAGVPVVHVEAGLRSSSLFDPFPEEIIRRFVSRLASLHLAPDEVSAANLRGRNGIVVSTNGNSLRDALHHSLGMIGGVPKHGGDGGYAVVSLHRNENLSNAANLDLLLSEMVRASECLPLVFVMHPATRERIRGNGWLDRLAGQPSISMLERMDHARFVRLLIGSRMLLTDGGSNQEEAAMLGLPTLLLRRHTERPDGLDTGVVTLSRLEPRIIRDFVQRHATSTWLPCTPDTVSPSRACVEALARTFQDDAGTMQEST